MAGNVSVGPQAGRVYQMKLSKVTFDGMVAAGVDCGKLIDAQKQAHEKRDVTRQALTESKKGDFSGSEGFKLAGRQLTDAQAFALKVFAFDCHMVKAAAWGLTTWEVPEFLTTNAKAFWPYKSGGESAVNCAIAAGVQAGEIPA